MLQIPTVSVCMITYNHEKYIEQAIEGVLMQECNFNIELIIANDNSPDNTDTIIRNIINTNPSASAIIKYTKHTTNLGVMANFIWTMKQCTGKYLALCDGDDYWTDLYKLQKQVDFLIKNPGYSICGTRVQNFSSDGKIEYPNHNMIGEITLNDVLRRNQFSTCTVVFNNSLLKSSIFKNLPQFFTGDWPIWCSLLTKGKGFNIDEITAQYNIHSGGVVSSRGKIRALKNKLEDRILMIDNFPGRKRIIKNYGYKILIHFLWKSLLFDEVYFKALVNNKHIVKSFILK